MKRRHLRRRTIGALGYILIGASTAGLGAQASFAADQPDPATACRNLASLAKFPLTPTQITLAKFNPSGGSSVDGVSLPDHCQVQGIINKRVGADGFPYGDS